MVAARRMPCHAPPWGHPPDARRRTPTAIHSTEGSRRDDAGLLLPRLRRHRRDPPFQWFFSAARRQDVGPRRARGTRVAAVVSRFVPRAVESAPDTATADAATPSAADQWSIECQWTEPRSGAVYTFRSDAVDDATARAYTVGAPIAVLIAPGDPDRYFVEVVER